MRTFRLLVGKIGHALIAACCLASITSLSAQTVVYRELFGNTNTGSPISIDNAGWLLARGSTGILDNNTATAGLRKATFTGATTSLTAVNSSSNPSSGTNLGSNTTDTTSGTGYFIRSTSNAANSLLYTSEYTVDRSAQEIANISFYLGNANVADTVRIAVEIGTSWYVTSSTFADTTAFIATTPNFEQKTFTWTSNASAWNSLTFNAGSSLAMGSTLTSALPSGNIVAFGLYYDSANAGNVSFDTYEIQATAVPEPATYAALMGTAMLSLAAWRRRRGR